MTVKFDTDIDWNSWHFDVLRWFRDNWLPICFSILLVVVALLIFNAFLSPYLTEHYKCIFRYETLLTDMKVALEQDYGNLWEDPDFCVAFLKFYEEYQTFVSIARSDHLGKLRAVSLYNRFARVRIG